MLYARAPPSSLYSMNIVGRCEYRIVTKFERISYIGFIKVLGFGASLHPLPVDAKEQEPGSNDPGLTNLMKISSGMLFLVKTGDTKTPQCMYVSVQTLFVITLCMDAQWIISYLALKMPRPL